MLVAKTYEDEHAQAQTNETARTIPGAGSLVTARTPTAANYGAEFARGPRPRALVNGLRLALRVRSCLGRGPGFRSRQQFLHLFRQGRQRRGRCRRRL